jgi:hypothetical protein
VVDDTPVSKEVELLPNLRWAMHDHYIVIAAALLNPVQAASF